MKNNYLKEIKESYLKGAVFRNVCNMFTIKLFEAKQWMFRLNNSPTDIFSMDFSLLSNNETSPELKGMCFNLALDNSEILSFTSSSQLFSENTIRSVDVTSVEDFVNICIDDLIKKTNKIVNIEDNSANIFQAGGFLKRINMIRQEDPLLRYKLYFEDGSTFGLVTENELPVEIKPGIYGHLDEKSRFMFVNKAGIN